MTFFWMGWGWWWDGIWYPTHLYSGHAYLWWNACEILNDFYTKCYMSLQMAVSWRLLMEHIWNLWLKITLCWPPWCTSFQRMSSYLGMRTFPGLQLLQQVNFTSLGRCRVKETGKKQTKDLHNAQIAPRNFKYSAFRSNRDLCLTLVKS